jgi:hypothetical protein
MQYYYDLFMYLRYSNAPFTKNKAKYVRYTRETLADMLKRLFEGQEEQKTGGKLFQFG